MEHFSVTTALAVHCTVVGILLSLGAVLLFNKGQLHMLASGFWVWVAAVLFFFLCPLVSLLTGELGFYLNRLVGTEGAARVYWILLAVVAGMAAFHLAYWVTPDVKKRINFEVSHNRLTVPFLLAFFAMALYSTFKYRSDILGKIDAQVVNGKFVGEVNGWQFGMHRFALFPMTFLLISPKTRWLGILTTAVFVVVRLFDLGDRFTMVTPVLAAIFLYLDHNRRKVPPAWMFSVVLLLTLFLVYRGHKGLNDAKADYSLSEFVESASQTLSGADTDMLPQFYRESAVYDKYGYTYGIPLFEAAAFGWLPRNTFPWKDTLFDDLIFKPNDRPILKILLGPKSSMIGNLYTFGSMPAIMIGMAIAGFFCRKLDGMLLPDQPAAVRALGFTYLSFIWLMFGSNADWTLQYIAVAAVPFAAVVALQQFLVSKAGPVTRENGMARVEGRRPLPIVTCRGKWRDGASPGPVERVTQSAA
jgi:hypothetical protein